MSVLKTFELEGDVNVKEWLPDEHPCFHASYFGMELIWRGNRRGRT